MPRDRAVQALWAGLRLAVIDLETTWNADHGDKVVSLGLVTCRAGCIQGRWGAVVNPGVPIRWQETEVHGLRDEDVAGAPAFADVTGPLPPALDRAPGERLLVVVHNATFDIPVLRKVVQDAGGQLAELPVLDTMGCLGDLAGVSPAGKSLEALLEALGLRNENPHGALADASATAMAVCELLARAAQRGHLDIETLLLTVEASTTLTQAGRRWARNGPRPALALPQTHLATHVRPLNAAPAARTLTTWTKALADCARLRCSHAAARVAAAAAPADTVVGALTDALATLAGEGDHVGFATLLDAAAPVLDQYAAGLTVRQRRSAALARYQQWTGLVAGVARCEKDQCPACREGRACGTDTWTYHLAEAALGRWAK